VFRQLVTPWFYLASHNEEAHLLEKIGIGDELEDYTSTRNKLLLKRMFDNLIIIVISRRIMVTPLHKVM
jgi:hypothetical protein